MKLRAVAFGLAMAGLAVAIAGVHLWRRDARTDAHLAQRFSQRALPPPSTRLDCALLKAANPVVLLALGQSNAGNHGTPTGPSPSVTVITDRGECHRVVDPLPGATGTGGSIWARLPDALQAEGSHRAWVIAVLAVDATTVEDWADAKGPIARALGQQLRHMNAAGMPPDFVLWQQGEANARLGTDAMEYAAGLRAVASAARLQGFAGPWLLAKSTVCRSPPSRPIRAAIDQLALEEPTRFLQGPDTDTLLPPDARSDGCHLSESGLRQAATAWAQSITQHAK